MKNLSCPENSTYNRSFGLRILWLFCLAVTGLPLAADELVLVENGVSRAPIVVFEGAPPFTVEAAEQLADYIEKTSGGRPEVIFGEPDDLPQRAIWVGYQPILDVVFPDLDFEFQHPEEILIAATGDHLVIAGRDVWDPDNMTMEGGRRTVVGVQQEYGTANAVYTFLQDFLGVRWLWPGELGEDVLDLPTVAFSPFEYRYHPRWRGRIGLFTFSRLGGGGGVGGISYDWVRHQRLQLDSLNLPGGHNFSTWWDRFHETDRDLFALQPNGSRGGDPGPYPSARTVKLCKANPRVWEKWLEQVEEQLEKNPTQVVFNAGANDGWLSGFCVCEKCTAWDHPEAEMRRYSWEGLSQEYVAMSERQLIFANTLARLLKERYPDKDYRVLMQAYGNSRPAPVEVVPDDNVIVMNVANFLFRSDNADRGSTTGATHREQLAKWGEVAHTQAWRPNTGSPVGWQQGLPDVSLAKTVDDFRHADASNCIGLFVDSTWEHWATQGPLYYLLAQLLWNPDIDTDAVMDDYYNRAFGPAAEPMRAYWAFMEEARETCRDEGHSRQTFYSDELFDEAGEFLDAAQHQASAAETELYGERVAYVRAGFDYTRLYLQCERLMAEYRKGRQADAELADRIRALWDDIGQLSEEYPLALNWRRLEPRHGRTAGAHPDGRSAAVKLPRVSQ